VIQQNFTPDLLLSSQFEFPVYCPVNKLPAEQRKTINETLPVNSDWDLRFLTDQQKGEEIDQYVIYTQMRQETGSSSSSKLFYCSWVTTWENKTDCSNAKHICSVPGPIFYVEKDKPVEVAWVYNL
jgi:hypothetical protein